MLNVLSTGLVKKYKDITKTLEQYQVLMIEGIKVVMEGPDYVYYVQESDWANVSENAIFRKPAFYQEATVQTTTRVQLKDGSIEETVADKDVKRTVFSVYKVAPHNVSKKMQKTLTLRARTVLRKGLVLVFPDGSRIRYMRVMRSASQYRTAKFLMTHKELVKEVRQTASYGWINTFVNRKDVNVAKVEPYLSLSSTTSKSVGTGWTSIDIEDAVTWVNIEGSLAVQNEAVINYADFLRETKADEEGKSWKEVDGQVYVSMELTDGMGMMSPKAGARASFRRGQITLRQYRMLLTAFRNGIAFSTQLKHPALKRIWDKISRGLQFRYGIKKGFLPIVDHNYVDANGKQYDLVFPGGAIKGQVRTEKSDTGSRFERENVELCIANASAVKEKFWGKLNYQFIQSLNISFSDLKALARKGIRKIVSGMESHEKAMEFLGMIASNEEDEVEQAFTTKLHDMLKANPRAFNLKWVQKQLKKLMEVSIKEMRFGRIPLEDARFVFIIADPTALMKDGQPLLKKGEYYFNGQTGQRAIFRSPLIHKSEAHVINLVQNEELDKAFGHLNNILVMNLFDDALPRLGGADVDGDKVLLTSEEIIINSIESLPMVYGDTKPKQGPRLFKWDTDGHDAISQYDSFTLTPSQIGTVTNFCTALVDQARDPRTPIDVAEILWDKVVVGRDTQGKVIDSAKTGQNVNIPESLKQEEYPHWLKDLSKATIKLLKNKGEFCNAYHSQAPMGRLYDYIMEEAVPYLAEYFKDTDAPSIKVLADLKYNLEEVENLIPAIEVLDRNYRLEMQDFFENNDEDVISQVVSKEEFKEWKKERSARVAEIIGRHKQLLRSLDYSTLSVAVACLHVAELAEDKHHTRACSYPYVVADEYMLAMLSHIEGNYKLVRVNNVDEDIWVGQAFVEDKQIVDVSGAIVGNVDVADGEYETFESNGKHYIKVPVASKQMEEVEGATEKLVSFSIKGHDKYFQTKRSHEEVMEYLNSREITTELYVSSVNGAEYVAVVVDGERVSGLGQESDIVAFNIVGKQMNVVGVKSYKGIVVVEALVKGDAPKVDVIPVQEPTPSVSVDNELEDDAMYYGNLF